MGFFSWDCKKCGKSMRSSCVAGDDLLSKVIVLEKDGSILKGEYDGYGRVLTEYNEHEIDFHGDEEPECYHQHCWEEAGKPTKWSESSECSYDQGFFID